MNVTTQQSRPWQELENQSDEGLRALIKSATDILSAREAARKKDACEAIRRIAREHGLDVAVKKPGRKRGRPPKAAAGG